MKIILTIIIGVAFAANGAGLACLPDRQGYALRPMALSCQQEKTLELAMANEDVSRIIASLASFVHGTNNATNVIEAVQSVASIMAIAYYDVNTNKSILTTIDSELIPKIIEIVIGSCRFGKSAVIERKFLLSEAVLHKDRIRSSLLILDQCREILNRWKQVSPGCTAEELASVNALEEVISIAYSRLKDRLYLMEGRISDEIFSLNAIYANFFKELVPPIKGIGLNNVDIGQLQEQVLIKGNKISIISLLCNLVYNALIYSEKDNPKVLVDTNVTDGRVTIAISDNGRGMSEEILRRIWEPFYTTKGTGIGLTESKLIAKDHGGTISVESNLGKGTTFTVTLPIAKSSSAGTAPKGETAPTSPVAEHTNTMEHITLESIVTFIGDIEEIFFRSFNETNLWLFNEFQCTIKPKILFQILSQMYGLPIGGLSANRLELITGEYLASDRTDYHQWGAIYIGGERVLFIDPSYGQFSPEYRGKILVLPYDETHIAQKYRLVENEQLLKVGFVTLSDSADQGMQRVVADVITKYFSPGQQLAQRAASTYQDKLVATGFASAA